jgi:hypothetical protein
MRKAAGVIMIILGAIVIGIIVFVLSLWRASRIDPLGIFMVAWTGFAFIGGILCLTRRYWGVCLASAIAAVVLGIVGFPLAIDWWGLPGIVAGIFGFPLVLAGGVVSTVFISLRKKEWQEISDLVDGNDVSDGD